MQTASKKDSIEALKELLIKCDETMEKYGETGHVFMKQILTYHPFKLNPDRSVAIPAKSFKRRLLKEIDRLEKR